MSTSGCSNFAAGIPDSAIAAWQPEGQSEDPRVRALAWAILAPNPHNLQPWLMELVGTDEVVVRIDTTRLLPETDPFGRQILIGTGAMLGLLDMAASEIGYQTETRWFENGEFTTAIDDRPVARVRFIKSANAQKDPLFQHIATRRTVRQTYDINRMPAAAFIDDMKQLSQTQALSMSVCSRGESAEHASEIAALAKQAWSIELLNPETLMESMRLLRVGSKEIEKHRDGISITAPFLVFLERFGLFDRSKVPDASSSTIQRQISEFESLIDSTPAFLVMTSEDNSRYE